MITLFLDQLPGLFQRLFVVQLGADIPEHHNGAMELVRVQLGGRTVFCRKAGSIGPQHPDIPLALGDALLTGGLYRETVRVVAGCCKVGFKKITAYQLLHRTADNGRRRRIGKFDNTVLIKAIDAFADGIENPGLITL